MSAAAAKADGVLRSYAGKNGRAVILIPKCAMRSMGHAVGKSMTESQAYAQPTRLAFIREPMDRLRSGFSHFFWMKERGTKYNGSDFDFANDWPTWVDYVLAFRDVHWQPQTEFIGDFPNTIHRFEDLATTWERYFPGYFPHIGKVTRVRTFNYRTAEIEQRYQKDFELWHSL